MLACFICHHPSGSIPPINLAQDWPTARCGLAQLLAERGDPAVQHLRRLRDGHDRAGVLSSEQFSAALDRPRQRQRGDFVIVKGVHPEGENPRNLEALTGVAFSRQF